MRKAAGTFMAVTFAAAGLCASASGQGKGGDRRPAPTPEPGAPQKWQVLGIEQALLLDGKPFPPRPSPAPPRPLPLRTFHVSGGSPQGGDGSEAKPWNDLAAALARLEPGDRLVVGKGEYGAIRIAEELRDGKPDAPIELVGDGASLVAPEGLGALAVERSSWQVSGFRVLRKSHAGPPLVVIAGTVRDVVLEHLRVEPGGGVGVLIASGARQVVLRESSVRGSADVPTSDAAVGVEVAAGTRDVSMTSVVVDSQSGPGIRIGARSGEPPRNVTLSGGVFRSLPGPAVWVLSGEAVRVADCDFVQKHSSRVGRGEALRIEGGREIVVVENHIRDWALAVRVGLVEGAGGRVTGPESFVLERTFIESRIGAGTAVAVEAGTGVRISNNIFEGLGEGILLFGGPPRTSDVAVANNLILGMGSLAFRIEDPACAPIFDHNVFTAAKGKLSAEVGGKSYELSRYLKEKKVAGSSLAASVAFAHRDLARVEGVEVVDRGRPLPNVPFKGKAPDLGVAEH